MVAIVKISLSGDVFQPFVCPYIFLCSFFSYKSLVYFLFAAEVGMEVPLYNAAMLCEENQVSLDHFSRCYTRLFRTKILTQHCCVKS